MPLRFMPTCRRAAHVLACPVAALLLLTMLSACAEERDRPEPMVADTAEADPARAAGIDNSIVDILRSDSRFSTLATALDSAGLATTLQGPGPFTVFAPANEAFDTLPQGGRDNLLMPENRDQLRDVLMHHVVDGRLTAQDLRGNPSVTALEGSDLTVRTSGDQVTVGDATVTEAGIEANNGIIHVINTVLVPEEISM